MALTDNLMEVFKDNISPSEIEALSFGTQKRTGERFAKATLKNGTTYIRTLSEKGVDTRKTITIPDYQTKEQRDGIVMELLNDYVQDDVADFMGLSQSTIHNIKKKYTK